jgi:glycosyltransferase involved in cell wall biosynthesis
LQLDILIPVYQPHSNWAEELILQFGAFRERLPEDLDVQVIMVNDGSARELEADVDLIRQSIPTLKWISYKENRGKGYALREAAKHSKGDLIMYTDYDFPYTLDSMLSMVQMLLGKECDAVVGNRDDSYYSHISPRRRRISQFLKKLNSLIFHLPTSDTQCGLKAFSSECRFLFQSTNTDRYLIDVEFLKKLSKSKAKVGVQLVKLRKGVVLSSISNLSLVKEAFNYFKIMLS